MPSIEVQQPVPVEVDSEEQKDAPGLSGKPIVGIIYPPPEVRNIVDKTASFVARNGPEFETRIRQNEINNPKFNFLNPTDPYHAYYQHKVKEFKEGRGQEPAAPKASLGLGLPVKQQEVVKAPVVQEIVPKEPPPEFEFIADPPSISAFDLDVVKLTAQFVARNGRQFLTNLMNREQRNYQFDFLRPQHSLFNYFTKLVEQYTKILIPPKDLLNNLKRESDNPKVVLDQVKYRVEWQKFQEREKRKEEEALEKERVAYAQVDWHDFVVVETVDFQHHEQGNFPPPTTPEEVGARMLAQERVVVGPGETTEAEMELSDEEHEDDEEEDDEGRPLQEDNRQVQDMEEESDEEGETPRPPKPVQEKPPLPPQPPSDKPQPPPLPPTPDQVIVRRDYNPKAAKQVSSNEPPSDQYLISPITGEKIPANKVQEHMRIGLLDPKWREQQERTIAERKEQEEVYAPGSAIDSSLKQLAERRTDIFGSGAEETQIGKKIGEEEQRTREKVTWDGHTASMEKVTQKARENITIEEQIAVIHKVKGLVEDEEKEKIGPAMPKAGAPPLPKPIMPTTTISMPKQQAPPPRPPSQPIRPSVPPHMPQMQQPGMLVMQARPPMMPPRPMMGVVRPPMPPMPPIQGMAPRPFVPPPPQPVQPAPQPTAAKTDEEPPSKKAKTEDQLVPEQEWIRRFGKGPVLFKVQIPNVPDKPEWKLTGQYLTFSFPLTDSVSVIKAKLQEELGMPTGKQKLQYEGIFIKDSNTLAYYNFMKGATVTLQLKERGGRKK
ncbi:splicing factor 3A subunit 1-like [Lingula anatina]|uniref:Splicing factor 3A subunit 1 n=1 Tax=Lingula anatina TaxID=7574 RepID=A0A1S3I9L5_LINAN|nr:splicing factor 3A subunit 1-like [Lingula anatina]|eukprot:XP_013393875.1 splicing factor 3A subunit 1-like [Lingula anatina]